MEMRVDTLRGVLELLNPAIPKKTVIPALNNVFLHEGRAEAFDLETAIAVEIDGADGSCLIPCRSVLELLKSVPGYEPLTIEQKAKRLSLTWDGGNASYDVDKPAEFPSFPKIEAEPQKTVDGDTMVPVLTSMVGYCSTDATRPVLTGVDLFLGENLEVAAGDGYRMAFKSLPMNFIIQGMETAIIPAGAISHLARLWKKTTREAPSGDSIVEIAIAKRMIDFTFHDGKVRIRFGRVTLVTKLIEGDPPKMKQLLPKETQPSVRFLAPDFERAVRRVLGPARDNSGIVRLSWAKKSMEISAKSDEKGNVATTIPVETEESGKVAISASYLLDYIRGKEGLIGMGVQSPQQPVLFRHAGSPLVLLMPLHTE